MGATSDKEVWSNPMLWYTYVIAVFKLRIMRPTGATEQVPVSKEKEKEENEEVMKRKRSGETLRGEKEMEGGVGVGIAV